MNLTTTVFLLLVLLFIIYQTFGKESFITGDFKTDVSVTLKTKYGKFIGICKNQQCGSCCVNNLCLKDQEDESTKFKVFVHKSTNPNDIFVSLKGTDSDYWLRCETCCETCEDIICADNANQNLDIGKFKVVKHNGATLLMTDNKKFVQFCSDCHESCKLLCAKKLAKLDDDNLGLTVIFK